MMTTLLVDFKYKNNLNVNADMWWQKMSEHFLVKM